MMTLNLTRRLALTALFLAACATGRRALHAVEKDVFNYEAQRDAPADTRRNVFRRAGKPCVSGRQHLLRTLHQCDLPGAYAVVYPDDKWPKDLSNADAIIVLLNHAARAASDPNIKAAMERGAGFMAIHFGVEVNKGSQGENYLNWMGGYFETFWSVNPWWTPDVQVAGKHPTARGVKPSQIKDEWYHHMRFPEQMKGVTPILSAAAPVNTVSFKDKPSDRGGNEEVLRAVKAGEPQHLAWAFDRLNGGRGYGFTGFHNFANLSNDSFRTALLNGIAWVSKLEIPAGGVASSTPTAEDLKALMDEAHKPPAPPAQPPAKQ